MIPGTAIPAGRPQVDDTLTPARSSQKVSDALSDFQPGQRLVATIQSQLANGTYRAMIAQRDVTLALPFSAKAGDQLKLEVVDTRGRVAFALADDGAPPDAKSQTASTTTTLSQAGRVIGTLFAKPALPGASAEPAPAALNRGQPLAPPPAENGAQLAPALQKAVAQSGVFFEAHLAAWLVGKYPKAELLREPLARLPRAPGATGSEATARGGEAATRGSGGGTAGGSPGVTGSTGTASSASAGTPPGTSATSGNPGAGASASTAALAAGQRGIGNAGAVLPGQPGSLNAIAEAGARGAGAAALFSLPAEAAPVVHQQLNALATHVYAFQGQAWADQRISWEIVDEDGRRGRGEGNAPPEWRSRLSLAMPALGAIDAVVQLRGNKLEISFAAPRDDTRQTLAGATAALRDRLSALGLALDQVRVDAPAAPASRHEPAAT